MAKNTTAYFLHKQVLEQTRFDASHTTTIRDIFTPATEDAWVYDIIITSTYNVSVGATIYLHEISTGINIPIKRLTGSNLILANQGTSGTSANPLRLLQSSDGNQLTVRLLDRDQNYYLTVPTGWKLRASMENTVASGIVTFLVMSRNFEI